MSYCLLHRPSSSTECSTANCSVLPYYVNCLLFSITTIITVTAVTTAVIISSLLLSQLLLKGRGFQRSFRDIVSFSYSVLLYFHLAIFLQHRMLGDNVLSRGGM